MADLEANYEVVVVGAGNAGLAAAISAAENGAKVAMLEKAPKDLRGGNTYFTTDYRFGWNSLDEDIIPLIPNISADAIAQMRETVKPYTPEQFYDDAMRISGGRSDPELLHTMVSEALPAMKWLRAMGHEWYEDYKSPGKSMVADLNGGGARLSDRGFDIAAARGVDIRYQNVAMELLRGARGNVVGVKVLTPQGFVRLNAKAVILACGGFEANPAMRATYLGAGWDTVKIRGVPFNTGDGLRMAWDIGAQSYGQLSGCHASAQDINRPPYSVRIQPTWEYNRYSYPWCIMVNNNCERFIDEGSDLRPYTYAKIGRAMLSQPQGVAFQIMDNKIAPLLHRYVNPTGAKADTLEKLAQMLGLDPVALVRTVQEYNQAVQPGDFNHRILDGKRTQGLRVNKSNWSQLIDTPPYHGYGVCCGITFTFGGLRINTEAEVLSTWEAAIPGLYACGEIVGGLFYDNYPGGSGLTQGAVFGRKAGRNAARLVRG
jgi:tricarballylate dehydrogenase